jgi:hypothetical protein
VWTNYTGQDPEVAITGNKPGKDEARTPLAKSFTFGINVSF